jgi:hypothetical protein
MIFFPKGHLAVSGNIFGCCRRVREGLPWVSGWWRMGVLLITLQSTGQVMAKKGWAPDVCSAGWELCSEEAVCAWKSISPQLVYSEKVWGYWENVISCTQSWGFINRWEYLQWKSEKKNQALWRTHIIPATQKAESGRTAVGVQIRQKVNETPSQPMEPHMMVHVCGHDYMSDRSRRIMSSRPAWAKVQDPIW